MKFRKTREVHRRDDLRVLDAVPAVTRAVSLGHRLENIQRDAIGAVTNRVERQLKPGLVALNSHRFQFLWIVDEDSPRGGIVGIGLQHRSGA